MAIEPSLCCQRFQATVECNVELACVICSDSETATDSVATKGITTVITMYGSPPPLFLRSVDSLSHSMIHSMRSKKRKDRPRRKPRRKYVFRLAVGVALRRGWCCLAIAPMDAFRQNPNAVVVRTYQEHSWSCEEEMKCFTPRPSQFCNASSRRPPGKMTFNVSLAQSQSYIF